MADRNDSDAIYDISGRSFQLYFEEYIFQCLAFFLRDVCGGCISYGDNDCGFFGLRHLEQFVAESSIKITYPACAESLLCSGQTKVLHGNGDIYVTVMFLIAANPFFIVKQGSKDI